MRCPRECRNTREGGEAGAGNVMPEMRDTCVIRGVRTARGRRTLRKPGDIRERREVRGARRIESMRATSVRRAARGARRTRSKRDISRVRTMGTDARLSDLVSHTRPARRSAAALVRSSVLWSPRGWCLAPGPGVGGLPCRHVLGMAARARTPGHRPPQPAPGLREAPERLHRRAQRQRGRLLGHSEFRFEVSSEHRGDDGHALSLRGGAEPILLSLQCSRLPR